MPRSVVAVGALGEFVQALAEEHRERVGLAEQPPLVVHDESEEPPLEGDDPQPRAMHHGSALTLDDHHAMSLDTAQDRNNP